MKNNQKGFGVVEFMLIFVVLSIVIGVSYYVATNNKSNNSEQDANADSTVVIAESTECGNDWTTIEHKNVVFPEWGVSITITDDLIGKTVCKKESYNPQYYVTTSEVAKNKCFAYLEILSLASPVISIWKYDADESALGNLNIDDNNDQTFQEFYEKNKVDDGNYVYDYQGTSGGSKYYNVGNSFFYQSGGEVFNNIGQDMDKFTDGIQPFEIDASELQENCPNVEAGYLEQFGDLASTLRELN